MWDAVGGPCQGGLSPASVPGQDHNKKPAAKVVHLSFLSDSDGASGIIIIPHHPSKKKTKPFDLELLTMANEFLNNLEGLKVAGLVHFVIRHVVWAAVKPQVTARPTMRSFRRRAATSRLSDNDEPKDIHRRVRGLRSLTNSIPSPFDRIPGDGLV